MGSSPGISTLSRDLRGGGTLAVRRGLTPKCLCACWRLTAPCADNRLKSFPETQWDHSGAAVFKLRVVSDSILSTNVLRNRLWWSCYSDPSHSQMPLKDAAILILPQLLPGAFGKVSLLQRHHGRGGELMVQFGISYSTLILSLTFGYLSDYM